jgi:HD-GYP domain-containing protein (c-di-GMP phosphodiesterase class II)
MHALDGRVNHSLNVANFARRIGMMIDLPKEELELLYISGLVHDFGFLTYSPEFISKIKSEEVLSEEEFDTIKQHPEKGVEYFKNINIELPEKIRDGILYHHERNDGSGYPEGRKGKNIPVFAKIIGVADAFEALTSSRHYHEKMTINSAEIVMRDLGRKKFDSVYIEALVEFFKKV